MSESHSHGHSSSASARGTSLGKIAGALGIASCFIGMAIFFAACFGFGAAINLALIPLALGIVSFALIIIAGFIGQTGGMEDTQVLASIFITLMGLVGGVVLFAAWQGWKLFA